MSKLKKQNISLKDKESLEIFLGGKVYLNNTFIGLNKDKVSSLTVQGMENAINYLKRKSLEDDLNYLDATGLLLTLRDIQSELKLSSLPKRIECYDISHISATFVYGSMVTFLNGSPAKSYYRLFKLPNKNDDFANLNEILTRRILKSKEGVNGWDLPDLFVIDGGKGQLSSIIEVFLKMKVEKPVCSLAKRIEEVFLADNKNIKRILLSSRSKYLFQRIRDESHRFAITASRNAKLKTSRKSSLDELSGIGEATKTKLLKKYKSLKNLIKEMDNNPDEIKSIVSKSIWESLKNKFG